MIHEILSLIWALIVISHSSLVRDTTETRGIYLEEYCPGIGVCPQGSHVLCMYYTPGRLTGPRCYQPMNITMTGDLAGLILDIVNAIRSKIALGEETGKKDQPLPRAYGMMKLKWDNELATFAQVMANQCILRHDLCRSSKKFKDPAQAAGLVRFSYPDWMPVSAGAKFKTTGLIAPKLTYAITQALRSWYNHKNFVTKEFIESHPDFGRTPGNGKLYLQMVYHQVTHMGCGIIGYTEYAYHDNNANLIYNSIQIICNFSQKPTPGQPSYETNQPTEAGYTVRCGCPPGFDEDSSCLCEDNSSANKFMVCEGKKCRPSVVLLPIFTVEDAPPKHLRRNNGEEDDVNEVLVPRMGDQTSVEKFPIFPKDEIYEEGLPHSTILPYKQSRVPEPLTYARKNKVDRKPIKPRHFNTNEDEERNLNEDLFSQLRRRIAPDKKTPEEMKKTATKKLIINKKTTPSKVLPKKTSKKKNIFAKAPKFSLPKPKTKPKLRSKPAVTRKKVVINKREFPPEVTHKSEEENNYNLPFDENYNKNPWKAKVTNSRPRKPLSESTIMKDHLNNTLPKTKFNKYLRNKFRYFENSKENINGFHTDVQNINEDADNKLMSLLDTLEQEVKHIELDSDKKQIFDAKIKKIYSSLVGKPKAQKQPKPTYPKPSAEIDKEIPAGLVDPNQGSAVEDLDDMFKAEDEQMQQMSDTEDQVQQDKQFSDNDGDIHNDDETLNDGVPEATEVTSRRSPGMHSLNNDKGRSQIIPNEKEGVMSDNEPSYIFRKNKVQNLKKNKNRYIEQKSASRSRVDQEKNDGERIDKSRVDRSRDNGKKLDKKRPSRGRTDKDERERDRTETEVAERDRVERDRVERDRLEKERLEREKIDRERTSRERKGRDREDIDVADRDRIRDRDRDRDRIENDNMLEHERSNRGGGERVNRARPEPRVRHKYNDKSIYRSDYKKQEKSGVKQYDDEQKYDVDNDIKGRPMYKNDKYKDKEFKSTYADYSGDDRKGRYEDENTDGNLDLDRRQFYQEKLNTLERKLHGMDENSRHATHQREISRRLMQNSVMRPQNDLQKSQPAMMRRTELALHHSSKDRSRGNNYYVANRARSLHDF